MNNWASLVFVRVYEDPYEDDFPLGYIFIRKPWRYGVRKRYYSMAGGHGERTDKDPFETALRELAKETGLHADRKLVREAGKGWSVTTHGTHMKHLFSANVSMRDAGAVSGVFKGDDGERPKFFSVEKFRALASRERFLPEHATLLVERGLVILPPQ